MVKQNIFGGDIGGPIGSNAKLGFFYFNLQGTRQRSGDSSGTYINTAIPYVPLVDRQSTAQMAADCGVPSIVATLPHRLFQISPTTSRSRFRRHLPCPPQEGPRRLRRRSAHLV